MNSGGRDHQEVGVGNSEGRSGRLATAGDTSTEPSSLMLFVSRQEPPYTESYVRWCGRTAGATPPPTRFRIPQLHRPCRSRASRRMAAIQQYRAHTQKLRPEAGLPRQPSKRRDPCRSGAPPRTMAAPQISSRPQQLRPEAGLPHQPSKHHRPCRSGAPPRTVAAPQISSRPQQLRPEAGLPHQTAKQRSPCRSGAPPRTVAAIPQSRTQPQSFAPRRGSYTDPACLSHKARIITTNRKTR